MSSQKPTIIVFEKSAIIRAGLVNILLEKGNITYSIEQYASDSDWELNCKDGVVYLILSNPSGFEKNKKKISALKQKYNIKTVGLIYSYHDPERLADFDALVHLNTSAEKIKTTIRELLHSVSQIDSTSDDTLSVREKEVLKWIASGYSTKKIADTLFISTHTVNAHRKNIMRKLDIKTISGMTIYAVLNNIINLEEA